MENFYAFLFLILVIAIIIAKFKYDIWKKKDTEERLVRKIEYEIELRNRPIQEKIDRMAEEKRKEEAITKYYPFLPLPETFRKKRTFLRDEYRVAIKERDKIRAMIALEELYLYAQYFVYCYGDDDNHKGVSGLLYSAVIDKLYENRWKIKEFKKHSFAEKMAR